FEVSHRLSNRFARHENSVRTCLDRVLNLRWRGGTTAVDQFGRNEPHHVRFVRSHLPLDTTHELTYGHPTQSVRRTLDRGVGQGKRAGELVGVSPDDR